MQELRLVLPVALASFACAHGELSESTVAPQTSRIEERVEPRQEVAVPRGWKRYVVRAGDTLASIARCRGVSLEELARVNELTDPDRLLAGASLHVPERNRCPATETVSRGAAPAQAPTPASQARTAPSPSAAVARAERLLAGAAKRYDAADFQGAIAGAEAAAHELEDHPPDPATNALRARCHVLAAMGAAGLDRREQALVELRRAFALDPGLTFDPRTTSPRVLELAQEAQSAGEIGESGTVEPAR